MPPLQPDKRADVVKKAIGKGLLGIVDALERLKDDAGVAREVMRAIPSAPQEQVTFAAPPRAYEHVSYTYVPLLCARIPAYAAR